MQKEFKFSCIIPVYNTAEYLDEAMQSIINQDIGFNDNVQCILVDDGSSDNSYEICLNYQKQHPENIIALTKENEGQGSARNLGLNYVNAEYITFLDSDDKLELNAFSEVYNFFLKHPGEMDVVSIPLIYFDARQGDHILNYKFKTQRIVDLVKNPQYPQLSMSSSFIKKEAFKDYRFDTNLATGEDSVLINKILLEKKKIGFMNSTNYFYRKRQDASSTVDNARSKREFFTPRLTDYFKSLIDFCLEKEGEVPDFIQYLIAYDAQWFYMISDFPKDFTKSEINEFWQKFYDVLSYIDEDVIKNPTIIKKIPIRSFLMYIKNHREFHIDTFKKDSKIFLKTNDFVINNLHNHIIYFDKIELKKDYLSLYGDFISSCDDDFLSIGAIKTYFDGKTENYLEESDKNLNENPVIKRLLGVNWQFKHNFHLIIPIGENKRFKIDFKVFYEENDEKITLNNSIKFRNSTNISNILNFLINDDYITIFEDNSLYVTPFSEEKYYKLRQDLLLNIEELLEDKKDLTQKNKLLTKKNEKLNKSLKKSKNKNKEISNSKSRKSTKILRKIKNLR